MGPMELAYVLELYVHVKEKKPAEIHIIWLLVKLCIRGNISRHTVIIGLHVHLKKSRERRNVPARVFNRLGKVRRVLVRSKFRKGHGISSIGSGVRDTICVWIRECAEEGNSVAAWYFNNIWPGYIRKASWFWLPTWWRCRPTKICGSTCIHTHYQAIVEKISRFGRAREK